MNRHGIILTLLAACLVVTVINVTPIVRAQTTAIGAETFTPEVPLPGVFEGTQDADETLLSRYLRAIYVYFIWIVGVVATVMVIYGGLRWVAAAGNPGQIKEARDIIDNAVIGVIIGLTSVVLLNIINPKLTQLVLPGLTRIEKVPGNIATHVCTPSELSQLIADKESSSCGAVHTLKTKIFIDPKTGLPAKDGKPAFDVCITAGCTDGKICTLEKNSAGTAYIDTGVCQSSIALVPQTNPRYASSKEIISHDTIKRENDYTLYPCGRIAGSTGAYVGIACPGSGGQCYSSASKVTIATKNGADYVPELACPQS